MYGSTRVSDVLASQNIKVGPHDLVAPAVSTQVSDGQRVVVRYGRLLTVTVDGQTTSYWTTSTTVAGALSELGIRADSAKLSVSRSQPLGRTGLAVSVTTPKAVTVVFDGKTLRTMTTGASVVDVLAELRVAVGAKDRVTPAMTTPVTTSGLKVIIARVTQQSVTATESIDFGTSRTDDATLFTGATKTLTAGIPGSRLVTYLETWVDGKRESRKVASSRVTTAPVTRVLAVGTKAKPVASSSAVVGSTGNAAMWDRIAQCESGGNWAINTGNGYWLWRALRFFSSHESTRWLTYNRVEFLANVAMFVPIGIFFVLLFGRRLWFMSVISGVLLTLAIEFAQLFIPGRVSDVRDLVANSLGTVVGVLVALLLTQAKARRLRTQRA